MSIKIKVAILINDLYLNTLGPLILSLEMDNRFSVRCWACRRVSYDFSPGLEPQEISNLLGARGITHLLEPTREDITSFGPDFVFTSNPYDMYIAPHLGSDWLSAHSRLIHISYGASLINWAGAYEFLSKNPFMERAWRVYTESPLIHRERRNFVAIGYEKLNDYIDKRRNVKKLDKRSIAWKPRWVTSDETRLLGLIEAFCELRRRYIINIIMHPMFLANNSCAVRNSIQDLLCLDDVNEIYGPYFLDYVLGSDIYVGDISSTLAEFTYTGRPIVYTGEMEGLNELGSRILEASYWAPDADIGCIIDMLELGSDPLRPKRENLFRELFQFKPCSPLEIIKQDLLSEMNVV